MLKEIKFGEDNNLSWIVIDSEKTELAHVTVDEYQLDTEAIAYALDKNERAHLDYDTEKGRLVLVYNALNMTKEDKHHETIPITFVAQKDRLMTIVNSHNNYIVEAIETYVKRYPNISTYKLLFVSLTLLSNRYFPVMDEIDRERNDLNAKLRRTTTKENLLSLSDLETGSVYLLAAANQNVLLLEQLKQHPRFQDMTVDEKEQLDDAMVEARQLVSMSQLNSQILQQLSGAYNNVLNNNLNDNLTRLNIISILLEIIAIITGFFGMNVGLPWLEEKNAWIYIIMMSFLIYAVGSRLLIQFMNKK